MFCRDVLVFLRIAPGNCFPFGGCNYTGEYQQIYSPELFAQPTLISAVAFKSVLSEEFPVTPSNATIEILLATTNRALIPAYQQALTDFASTSTTRQPVFSGTYTPTLFGDGSFDLVFAFNSPYLYDPAQGNLLLSVVMGDTFSPSDFIGFDVGARLT